MDSRIIPVDYQHLPLPFYSQRDRAWELPGFDSSDSWEWAMDNFALAGAIYHYDCAAASDPEIPASANRYYNHTHSWESLLKTVMCYPESFRIPEECRGEYSEQQLSMVSALQSKLRDDGFGDGDIRWDDLYPSNRSIDTETSVVAGAPGIGKSITARALEGRALDLDCRPYKYLDDSETALNPAWPSNYCEAIGKLCLGETYDLAFISTDIFVLSTLERMGISYVLVYPDENRCDEFLRRFKDRGDSPASIESQIGHWDTWIDLYDHGFNPSSSYKLAPGQDLIDILDYPDFAYGNFAPIFYDWKF